MERKNKKNKKTENKKTRKKKTDKKASKRRQIEKFDYVYEKIEKGEVKLTESQIKAIHRGLKIIASKDPDKASLRNRQGFGAVDSAIGHSLANKTKLKYNEAVKGLKLVFKYRRQLPGWLKKKIFSPYLYRKNSRSSNSMLD